MPSVAPATPGRFWMLPGQPPGLLVAIQGTSWRTEGQVQLPQPVQTLHLTQPVYDLPEDREGTHQFSSP